MTAQPAAPALVTTRCPPARIRLSYIEQIDQRLSTRDTQIVDTISRLRLATGAQLERLHFADLAHSCRSRVRRRVLHRLVSWRVLATLPRRVGGIRAGSTGLIYSLDTAGAWLMRLHAATTGQSAPRRATCPGAAFTSHTLAVTELYVHLVERAPTGNVRLLAFDAEPACWWPDDLGGHLKPDAYALLAAHDYRDAWWIEVDQATETLPRLKKKLLSYLDFQRRGGIGPAGVLPRVLLTTPTAQRCAAITGLMTGLPPPADALFHAVVHQDAADVLIRILLNP